MTVRRLLALTLSGLCLGVFAFAEDDKPGAEGEMPPMGPPAELKQFDYLMGKWDSEFQMRETPEGEWTSSPSVIVYEKGMDGACIRGSFSSKLMGMDFKGQSTLTYHRAKAKWQMTWIDNMGAAQTYMEGDFKDGVLTLAGEDVMMGQNVLMRDVTTLKSDTEYVWEMHVSHDGGKTWWINMKGLYKKQA